MNIILTIIAVIVIFSVLVLIHEFGHFWAAKKAGVKVLEFGIGFPPRLFSKKHGETLYSINAVPFGGFVRLFGEDARDPSALTDKKSFAVKTPWTRTKIIVAGVFMNFLLAYVLLTAGFTFGIEPLILNERDLFQHLTTGTVETKPGVFVRKIKKGSAAEKAGIQKGDELLRWDGIFVNGVAAVTALEKGNVTKDVDLTFRRKGEVKEVHFIRPEPKKHFGLEFHSITNLPKPAVASVKKRSLFEKAGLQKGDLFLKVNNQEVYSPNEVIAFFSQRNSVNLSLLRSKETVQVTVDFPVRPRVLISEVFNGSAAEKAGMQSGDALIEIGDKKIETPQEVQAMIRNAGKKPLQYVLKRGDEKVTIETATDEKNILGVSLTPLSIPPGDDISFHQSAALTSLTKIHDINLTFPQALSQAFRETGRLTKVTVLAFGRTLKGLVTKLEVPEDIGGPVQIAYYTHAFVQEGFFALLRFTALLSLSLAVINILPFPALDGGRFLFIVLEVIFRRRLNARFESMVHGFGFLLLLLLIILVTFSDFAKIFA